MAIDSIYFDAQDVGFKFAASQASTRTAQNQARTTSANDAMAMRYQAMQEAIEAGRIVTPSQQLAKEQADRVREAEAVRLISGGVIPEGVNTAEYINTALNVNTFKDPVIDPVIDEPPAPVTKLTDNPAYAIALKMLAQYNLKGIVGALEKVRLDYPELAIDDILFLAENDERYNAPFLERFKANQIRESKGLPKLSAADYLGMEMGYQKLFTKYGLPMLKTQSQYDKLVANDIDTADATDRVVLAYDRVLTDTAKRQAFGQFYGSITDSEIVAALLSPEEQIPVLERKVLAAEIGGAALRQGLSTSLVEAVPEVTADGRQITGFTNVTRSTMGADTLAGEGVTEAQARAGYARIAGYLPEAEKLSAIYGKTTEQFGRKEAEQAELLGLESAKRKARKVAELEEASFSGESGTSRTSLKRSGSNQY
jgi:hypothetical protein